MMTTVSRGRTDWPPVLPFCWNDPSLTVVVPDTPVVLLNPDKRDQALPLSRHNLKPVMQMLNHGCRYCGASCPVTPADSVAQCYCNLQPLMCNASAHRLKLSCCRPVLAESFHRAACCTSASTSSRGRSCNLACWMHWTSLQVGLPNCCQETCTTAATACKLGG